MAMAEELRREIALACSPERAFRAFTEHVDLWWPHAHRKSHEHAMRFTRDALIQTAADGSEWTMGRVLAWDPPNRVVVTWQINGQWQFDPDPAHASEVDVRFTADGPDRTTVDISHQYVERLVGAQAVYDAFLQGGSWTAMLERFAKGLADAE